LATGPPAPNIVCIIVFVLLIQRYRIPDVQNVNKR
jgi:hypothetical protein